MNTIVATVRFPVIASDAAAIALANLLDTLADANALWFESYPNAPRCAACAGAKYLLPGMDLNPTYSSAPDILEDPSRGWQCADLVAYDVGRLRSLGRSASVEVVELAPFDFHVVLESPERSGQIYDISREIAEGEGCPCVL